MKQTDFRILKDEEWLNDTIIDISLPAHVQEAVPSTHCYTTHVFDKLLEGEGAYNFQEVSDLSQRIGQRIEGGLFVFDNLFLPINVNSQHWLFQRVDIKNKLIELYDSKWVNTSNREYLTKMRYCLYDAAFNSTPANLQPILKTKN